MHQRVTATSSLLTGVVVRTVGGGNHLPWIVGWSFILMASIIGACNYRLALRTLR